MKKILSLFFLFIMINNTAKAVDFDSSIDSNIRKTYNLEESTLPPLPNEEASQPVEIKTPKYSPIGKTFTLKRGTKLNLQLSKTITDRTKEGAKVSFILVNGITTIEGQIIPSGTIVKGTITDSHTPQLSGNGGLIELTVDEIYFNGIMSQINTKIASVNSKKVFLGNIKGKRSYWNNFSKAMTPGKKVFGATQTCANAMSHVPIINLISFVPIVGGAALYSVNLAVAPVAAAFTKGKSITLPAGTKFVAKITENCKIRG